MIVNLFSSCWFDRCRTVWCRCRRWGWVYVRRSHSSQPQDEEDDAVTQQGKDPRGSALSAGLYPPRSPFTRGTTLPIRHLTYCPQHTMLHCPNHRKLFCIVHLSLQMTYYSKRRIIKAIFVQRDSRHIYK